LSNDFINHREPVLFAQSSVDRTIQLKLADKQRIAQRPRRSCGLPPAPADTDVIGKVCDWPISVLSYFT